MEHVISYDVSNSATCTCGWRTHTAHGDDLDLMVDVHLGLRPESDLLEI